MAIQRWRIHLLVTSLVGLSLLAPGHGLATEASAPPEAGKGAWLLSTRSYWRHHYTFAPTQSFHAASKALEFLPNRYAALNTGALNFRLATPPPAETWMQPEFDDAGWCVQRAPLPWIPDMDQDGSGPYTCHWIRKACGRTRFLVDDLNKVNKATLTFEFYGGLVVYLNGKELARSHVSKDPVLAREGFAEPYPQDAYRPGDGEPMKKAAEAGLLDVNGWLATGTLFHPWRIKPEALPIMREYNGLRLRKLEIAVSKQALRAGVNVLAVENLLSPVLVFDGKRGKVVPPNANRFPHIGIQTAGLACEPADALRSADVRPAGVQAWAEDIHRWVLKEDFLEPGVKEPRKLALLAPRNGAASAQVVLGTSKELAAPAAVLSDLAGPNGAKLPAVAVQLRWGVARSIKETRKVELSTSHPSFRVYMHDRYLIRNLGAPPNTWAVDWGGGTPEMAQTLNAARGGTSDLHLYDQLTAQSPARIEAGTSQTLWLTLEIPKDTAPGTYKGQLTVKAGGMEPVQFGVEAQVFALTLAEPQAFTAYSGIDESPWALAAWHGVKLWSDEHWTLVEQSLRLAGKLGARVVGVPVIHNTELNNEGDAMVKWVKKPDGSYGFDFAVMDRYLDLWRKYCHSQSDVIVYLVHTADGYGKGGGTGKVTLLDPSSGKETVFEPPKADTPEGRKLWVDCAKAVHARLREKGFADGNVLWGLFYDYIGVSSYALAEPLAQELPGVGWARSSHEGRKLHGNEVLAGKGSAVRVSWNAAVRGEQKQPFTKEGKVATHKGWNTPDARLLLPRADSDVNALTVYPPLWQLRAVQEMAVTSAQRGFARICIDGWKRGSYFGPFNSYLTYPAPGGGGQDGSVQFEILREGLQETEARIALEKVATLPADVQKILDFRTERLWVLPPRPEGQRIGEYYSGWQELSWDLYAAAATGGDKPTPQERSQFLKQGVPQAGNK